VEVDPHFSVESDVLGLDHPCATPSGKLTKKKPLILSNQRLINFLVVIGGIAPLITKNT
jgi:hypothetical protein